MAESVIDFGAGQASGLEELAGASPTFVNLLRAADGTVQVRPLVKPWADWAGASTDGNPVVGVFPWRNYLIVVTQNATTGVRKLWAWLGPGNVIALSSGTAVTQLDGTGRPVFTFDSQRVVVAGGGAPQKWEGTGLSTRLGGSPPNLTHIGYAATRFVGNANDISGEIFWTPPGVGNHETWNTGLDFAEAEAAPDPTIALYVNSNEVAVWGSSTMQVYVPDPSTSFSTTTAALTTGCAAPYSVISIDTAYAWLDEKRRFVQSDGRQLTVLSLPLMSRSLEQLTTVTDCWGSRIRIGAYDILLWVFPTEGRAIYYERISQKWGEWRSWDGNDWIPWIGQSYVHWPEKNLHLVGLSDGTVGELSMDATTEMGQGVKAVSRTGFIDQGAGVRKLSTLLRLRMRRGATAVNTTSAVPAVEIAYRDDLGAFNTPMSFSLGAGDYAPTIDRWGLGMYRQRQYELTWLGSAEFVLAEARETYVNAES